MDSNEHPMRAGQYDLNSGGEGEEANASFCQILIRRLAVVLATGAVLLTGFCFTLQALPAEGASADLAGRWLVPSHLREDWSWALVSVRGQDISNGQLADHVLLAGLQRRWFFGTSADEVFRLHVLNPFLDDSITDSRSETGWRRPLWEALWQLVRKENSRGEAAQKVRRLLYERVSITKELQGGFLIAWGAGQGSREEFERLTVAALRAVGIPARAETDGMAAWFEGAEWRRFSEIDAIHQVLSAP